MKKRNAKYIEIIWHFIHFIGVELNLIKDKLNGDLVAEEGPKPLEKFVL